MHVSRLPALLRPGPASVDDAALELVVGDEVIEVRVDREEAVAGLIALVAPWPIAVVLSLTPILYIVACVEAYRYGKTL